MSVELARPARETSPSSRGPEAETSKAAEPARQRHAFIDLMRGYALIVMIETHVVNAYLPQPARHGSFFFWLTFVNGLVAPAFLFVSGFSTFLQASRNWQDWLYLRRPFWKQMQRLGFILLIAYYTHLQHFALSRYLHPTEPNIWKASLRVDILQCIVVSLLTVNLLVLILRTPGRFALGAVTLGVGFSIATPWMWAQDFSSSAPLALALFLNPHGVSLFPLFPWTCFVLAGAVMGYLFLQAANRQRVSGWLWFAVILGCGMIAAGLLGRYIPFELPGRSDFFRTSPLYVLVRLGCVLILCAFVCGAERLWRWAPKPVRLAGQESLLVYGVHLWLIFALLRGKHLKPVLGAQLGLAGCFLLSAAIIVFMLWLAIRWRGLKQDHPRLTKAFVRGTVTVMIIVFVLR